MADLDEVLAVYEDLLAEAYRRGSTFTLVAARGFRAQTLLWRGDLTEAEADAREALAAGEAWSVSARFSEYAAAFLADSLMEQGRLDEAASVLSHAAQGARLSDGARQLFLADSGARLRILRGDLAGGSAELLDAGRRFEAVGSRNPAFIAWRSPAALALNQLGERDQARRLAAEELELARTWGAPRALGAALRAAGLAEGGERGLALLEEAVEVLSGSPARLEARQGEHRAGRGASPGGQPRPARETAPAGGRARDALRRCAARGARGDRAARHRRAAAPDRPERRRVAHAQRAPRRRDGSQGTDQPRDRAGAVRHAQDR